MKYKKDRNGKFMDSVAYSLYAPQSGEIVNMTKND